MYDMNFGSHISGMVATNCRMLLSEASTHDLASPSSLPRTGLTE